MAAIVSKNRRVLAALGTSAAFLSLAAPVLAQDWHGRDRGEHRASSDGNPGAPGNARSWGGAPSERGQGGNDRAAQDDWRSRGSGRTPQGASPPAPSGGTAPTLPVRNPSYVDPRRDGSYGATAAGQAPPRQQAWSGQAGGNQADPGRVGRTWNRSSNTWNSANDSDPRPHDGDRRPDWQGSRTTGAPRWDNNRDWNRDSNRERGWEHRRDNVQGHDWGQSRDWHSRNNSWSSRTTRDWNRDWRQDHRYDWQGWRNAHRDTYRLGRYNPPYNHYSYRRLGIGFTLDNVFFGSSYWIGDPWSYRLPEAYGPYRWVRYYDDALLVDVYSGEVVDVIYDVFW